MSKIVTIVFIALLIIAGTSYGQSANPFTGKDDDLYFEGWYAVNGSGNLTGMLTIDIINSGSSAWSRIDYSGISDFHKCAMKPSNWTCHYDSDSNIVSFIIDSGDFGPQDRVSLIIMYKDPLNKILTSDGYVQYANSEGLHKMDGLTKVTHLP
jgi:hypothetical protein